MHGSNLIAELRRQDAGADIRCWGGDRMEAAGGTLVKHYRDLAFMGFTEVLMNLRTILRNLRFCKEDILQYRPDTLVLIDYPGFNLRIARWAKQQGFRVVFYISPQVWAWKENRVKMMKECIDKMIVILPFEKDYFKRKWNWDVEYVGHPLVQVIDNYRREANRTGTGIIALLPGSRKQEIRIKLPIMLAATKRFPDYPFVVAKAPAVEDEFYQPFIDPYPNVSTAKNRTYDLLVEARAALVTSGTATLETALFEVPQVVCYKGSPISYAIAKRVIRVKYISLVNLIMDRPVVTELIQHELTVDNLERELRRILEEEEAIRKMKQDYTELKALLGVEGNASAKAAELIIRYLKTGA